MIKIAVIDDDANMLTIICDYIAKTIAPYDNIICSSFTGAEKFLNRVEQGEKYDILFSDIELSKMSGIELGKRVRSQYPEMYLIFVTSHTEFAIESYILDAYQYILKQDMEARLPQVLNKLIDKIQKENSQYKIIGNEHVKVYYKDIIYINKDKSSKYVEYITVNEKFKERSSIGNVMQELQSKEFILVERGCIINMKHIEKMEGNLIHLDNNERIMVSRARLSKVKEQINMYWRKI